MYNLGKFLRKRYDKFLGKIYKPVEFYTQATDVDRTKATVQLINAGLWPPEPLQQWGALKWQPIPVHMEPLATDTVCKLKKFTNDILITVFFLALISEKTMPAVLHRIRTSNATGRD